MDRKMSSNGTANETTTGAVALDTGVPPIEPQPTTSGHLLDVRHLRTSFATPLGTVRAVDGVSFTLDRGQTLGIVGESGSGKTVLSRSVMRLLTGATVTTTGNVLFEGRDLTELDEKRLRSIWGAEIAMVFQDPMTSLNPVVRIGRQITEPLRKHLGLDRDEATSKAIELLGSVGIPAPEQRIKEYPFQLSGGMRQRVTIAIALSCGPKLLIGDEPTTALDVTVQKQILDLLRAKQLERDMGMILITHDLGVVANYADEILVMYAGQVVERAPTATLFSDMRHPYTEALLTSIPRIENPSQTPLDAIPGRPPDLTHIGHGCRFAPRCKYRQARCVEEDPQLEPEGNAHFFRCFYPVDSGTSNHHDEQRAVDAWAPDDHPPHQNNETQEAH